MEFLKHAVMMNHASDQIDMSVGFPLGGGRLPIEQISRAIQGSPTLNNFVVKNSQIGVLNTGNIKKIDAAITLSKGSDVEPIADKILEFTKQLLESDELSDNAKNDALELTEAISEEVVQRRRLNSLVALTKELREKVGGSLALSNAANGLWNLIEKLL